MTIELKTNHESIFVSSLYRPPNSNGKKFLKNYSRLPKKFTTAELTRLIIGMDHNLNLIKHDKHPLTTQFIELNLEEQLLPTITKRTRVTRNSATLIDNIMIGRKFQPNYKPNIIVSDLSDQFPCLFNIKNSSLFQKKGTEISTRALNPHRVEEIKLKLSHIDWTQESLNKTTNDAFDTFHEKLMNTID